MINVESLYDASSRLSSFWMASSNAYAREHMHKSTSFNIECHMRMEGGRVWANYALSPLASHHYGGRRRRMEGIPATTSTSEHTKSPPATQVRSSLRKLE